MNKIENVVYRYHADDEPAVRYHAIPSGCAGGAEELNMARSSYRRELSALLNVDRHQLPSVVEHLEAVVDGMWVRTRVGAVHRDHGADRMFLQTLLAPDAAQAKLREHLDLATNRGLEPIVVIVEPTDSIGTVLDQMTPHDTVMLAYSDAEATVGWAVMYGPEADGRQHIPRAPSDIELRHMPVWEFAHRYGAAGGRCAVRMDARLLPLAS
jgi:hypothetical protein